MKNQNQKQSKNLTNNSNLYQLFNSLGFANLTEIQKKASPIIVQKKDCLVIAPTGSGKTETSVIPIFSDKRNIEDCKAHRFKVRWFSKSKIIQVHIDGKLRMNKKYDLVKNIFSKNSNVYWGFTAATGGKYNLHQVCLEKLEFAESLLFDEKTKQKLIGGTPHDLENVDFITGSTELEKDALDELERLVALLKENPHLDIYVNGHTDSGGPADKNKRLSKRRADVVKKYLTEKGIAPKRIHTSGSGERFPKASNDTPKGRKINRN